MPLSTAQIRERLPHAPPFLFLDEVTELSETDRSARAVKRFARTEFFFQGHFPGHPIVPGVILAEALAQLSGLVLGLTVNVEKPVVLARLDVKFRHVVRPDETVLLSAKHLHSFDTLHGFEVSCSLRSGRLVAEGQLTLALVDERDTA